MAPAGGLEYVIDSEQPPSLFVIRKQMRKGPDTSIPGSVTALAYYYILDKCVMSQQVKVVIRHFAARTLARTDMQSLIGVLSCCALNARLCLCSVLIPNCARSVRQVAGNDACVCVCVCVCLHAQDDLPGALPPLCADYQDTSLCVQPTQSF